MNYVDFETAVKLREAGFPQPEPAFGQLWYHVKSDRHFLVVRVDGVIMAVADEKSALGPGKYPLLRTDALPDSYVFAPTATDILPLIFSYVLANDFASDEKGNITETFFSCYDPDTNAQMHWHENPAEAAAAAWLEMKAAE